MPPTEHGKAEPYHKQALPLLEQAGAERLQSLAQVEEGHILSVLESTGWNKSRAARVLGISRQGLLDRLKKMKIEIGEHSAEPA